MMLKKPVVLVPGHAVVEKVLINGSVQMMAIRQVEREKPLLVESPGVSFSGRTFRMKVLRGFALYENRVGPVFKNCMHGQHVRLTEVLKGLHEGDITLEPLVPPA